MHDALAKILVISSSLTLPKQDLETFVHVDPQKLVDESDTGGENGENDRFGDPRAREVLSTERLNLEIVLDHERAVQSLLIAVMSTSHSNRDRKLERRRTPKMPIRMKNPSSKKCQSRSK